MGKKKITLSPQNFVSEHLPATRRNIYLAAAEYFSEPYQTASGMCRYCTMKDFSFDALVEYHLFSPHDYNPLPMQWRFWFATYDQSDRINALLFCAEMCK